VASTLWLAQPVDKLQQQPLPQLLPKPQPQSQQQQLFPQVVLSTNVMQNYDLFLWDHQLFYEQNRSKSENGATTLSLTILSIVINTKWETHQK